MTCAAEYSVRPSDQVTGPGPVATNGRQQSGKRRQGGKAKRRAGKAKPQNPAQPEPGEPEDGHVDLLA